MTRLKWLKRINFRLFCEIHWCLFTDALLRYEKALLTEVDKILERVMKSQSYLAKCIAWRRWDAKIISYFLWLSACFCDMRWLRWPKLLKMLTNLWETTLLCDLQAIFCDTSSLEWLKFWNVRLTCEIWCCLAICGLTFAIWDGEIGWDC